MPLIGGAGNPVGGSFTGPAEALEVIGNHAYAYSNVLNSTSSQTVLNFTSGNYYFVGKIEMNPAVQYDDQDVGALDVCRITLNGSVVGLLVSESTDFYRTSMNLIIPAYTEVTVEVISSDAAADEIITVGLTGQIYRE